MTQKSARKPAAASSVKSLSFDEIPGQSRLFLDYLKEPRSLKKYYPNAVESPLDGVQYRDTVLSSYTTNRDALCNALTDINVAAGAGESTLRNIELLRKNDTVAVVTGQQAGLFTGPLYTIYKALSAIRLAEYLCSEGVNAVPVFWIASEDHDLAEIDHAFVLEKGDGLDRIDSRPDEFVEGRSVGEIVFDESIEKSIEELFAELPKTEFSNDLRSQVTAAYQTDASYGTAFATFIMSVLGKYGLTVLDPLDSRIKRLSSPIYVDVVERSDEIVASISARNKQLEVDGYFAQVLVEEDYFPLFWHDDDGRRLALRRTGDGMFRVKGEKREMSRDELLEMALSEPRRFSPGVMVRPVVQDFLLPTICYFGGGAEIAYFAQNSEAYRVLDRPVTPIFHRQSFTVVEPRERRNLEHLDLRLQDLFIGKKEITMRSAEKYLSPTLAQLFPDIDQNIQTQLDRLERELSKADATLVDNLAARRKKIIYHIAALKEKVLRSQIRKDETLRRRIDNLFDSLLPNGSLQERELNVVTFLNKYGPRFIDWLYDAVDLSDKDHRIIEL